MKSAFYALLFIIVIASCKHPQPTVMANTRHLVDLSNRPAKSTFVKTSASKTNTTTASTSATQNTESTTTPSTTTSTDTSQKKTYSRIIVSFISIGEGSDAENIMKFKDFANKYKSKNLSYNVVPWGREGEVDICFPLTELTAIEQREFIKDVKNELKGSKLVRYYEYQTCREENK